MAVVAELIARVRADTRGLEGGLKRGSSSVQSFKKNAVGALKALGPALGAASLVAFGKSSVDAFNESELAALQMGNAIKNNRQLAGSSVADFQNLASAIQEKTAADDESVVQGAAVLANFGLTRREIEDTIPAIVDYARKTGKTVPDAAKGLGKAALGNARALKDLGIDFKKTGDKTKDFRDITQLLRDKVGGFATKEAETTAGKLKILRNRFNDFQEVIGEKVLKVVGFLIDNFAIFGPILGAVAAAMLFAKIQTLALNLSMTANPIGILVAAFVLLILVIWNFRKQILGALKVVGGAFVTGFRAVKDAVLGAVRFVVDKFLGMVGFLIRGAARAFGWVPGIGGKLRKAAKDFERFRDDVNRALGGVNREITVRARLSAPAFAGGPTRFAHGGPFRAHQTMLVGEAGPELVRFDRGGTVIPSGRAGGMATPDLEQLLGAAVRAAVRGLTIEMDRQVVGRVVDRELGARANRLSRGG